VGATFWNEDGAAPLYGLETFSSLGPRNASGGSNPGTTVNKPDVVAPDGVNTATNGVNNGTNYANGGGGFWGTSASTPHVAGLAATAWEGYPGYTLAELRNYVQNQALDKGDGGSCGGGSTQNNRFGWGRIKLGAPPSSAATPTATPTQQARPRLYLPLIMKRWVIWVPDTPTPTPTKTPTPTVVMTATPTPTQGPAGWVTLVSTDFEGDFPGPWAVHDDNGPSYGEYYWGKRTCKPYAGSYSGWGVGGGANGAALACGSNYPDNAASWMAYGPFSLVSATAGELSFKLWLNSQPNNDKVCRYASINGTNWSGNCTSGNTAGWVDKVLDLTNVPTLGNLLGQPNVWVALVFQSDNSTNNPEGGYVDNIVLRKCTAASCPASVAPNSSSQTVDVPATMTLGQGIRD
jgi:subtilisin family serine protease